MKRELKFYVATVIGFPLYENSTAPPHAIYLGIIVHSFYMYVHVALYTVAM